MDKKKTQTLVDNVDALTAKIKEVKEHSGFFRPTHRNR